MTRSLPNSSFWSTPSSTTCIGTAFRCTVSATVSVAGGTSFLRPTSLDELAPRLAARGTETPEERRIRLDTAEREMQHMSEYDYVIVNKRGRLDRAVGDLKAI